MLVIVAIQGCASKPQIIIQKEYVKLQKPEPISIIIPKWHNMTGDFCLTPNEYEKLGYNMYDINRYIKQMETIINNHNQKGDKDE